MELHIWYVGLRFTYPKSSLCKLDFSWNRIIITSEISLDVCMHEISCLYNSPFFSIVNRIIILQFGNRAFTNNGDNISKRCSPMNVQIEFHHWNMKYWLRPKTYLLHSAVLLRREFEIRYKFSPSINHIGNFASIIDESFIINETGVYLRQIIREEDEVTRKLTANYIMYKLQEKWFKEDECAHGFYCCDDCHYWCTDSQFVT